MYSRAIELSKKDSKKIAEEYDRSLREVMRGAVQRLDNPTLHVAVMSDPTAYMLMLHSKGDYKYIDVSDL